MIDKLEGLVVKLTLINEFLKWVLKHSLSQSQRKGKSSAGSTMLSGMSGMDVDR